LTPYIYDNLLSNEKILFVAEVHSAIFLPTGIAFAGTVVFMLSALPAWGEHSYTASTTVRLNLIIAGLFLVYSVILGIQATVVILTTEFAVTNRRVIAKTGFIKRHTLEILLDKVESMKVRQNILGRLLGFGTVTIAGTGGTRESFKAIADPAGVRKKINQVTEYYVER